MKSPKLSRSFILSYVAIAVVTLATGILINQMPSISADTSTASPTPTGATVALQGLNYQATVDGNAVIQFIDGTATVLSSDYRGVSAATVTGDLTGCQSVALSGDTTGRVTIKQATSPFQVKIRDNGSGTPPPYNFTLFCTNPLPTGTSSTTLKSIHYQATVDGNARIQFIDNIATVLSADYRGVSAATETGDLTGCTTAALANETTGRVSLTTSTSPFIVNVYDNGSGTPPPYTFDLVCADPLPSTAASNSVTLKPGFNTVFAASDNSGGVTLDSSPLTTAGMILFDFNRLGQKTWRTTANGDSIPYLYNKVGYYVYNPGTVTTLNLSAVTVQPANAEGLIKVRRGWNLVTNPTSSSQSLANLQFNVLNAVSDNTCVDTSCYTSASLHDLMQGDDQTRRAYNTIFQITNGNTTDASQAFTTKTIDSSNIDSASIPSQTVFWLYLFN